MVLHAIPAQLKVQFGILATMEAKAAHLPADNELEVLDTFLRHHFPTDMVELKEISVESMVEKLSELAPALIGTFVGRFRVAFFVFTISCRHDHPICHSIITKVALFIAFCSICACSWRESRQTKRCFGYGAGH